MIDQELHRAAEKYAKQFDYAEDSSPSIDFIEGAQWQQERMYSEEEVLQLLNNLRLDSYNHGMGKIEFLEWFEQFKK